MTEADVLRVILTLVFIVVVILASAWLVRRSGLGRSGNPQALRLIGSQSLGNRAWVTIVEVEDARLVLGVTAQQINLLHTLPPSPPETARPSEPGPDGSRFTASLSRALKRR